MPILGYFSMRSPLFFLFVLYFNWHNVSRFIQMFTEDRISTPFWEWTVVYGMDVSHMLLMKRGALYSLCWLWGVLHDSRRSKLLFDKATLLPFDISLRRRLFDILLIPFMIQKTHFTVGHSCSMNWHSPKLCENIFSFLDVLRCFIYLFWFISYKCQCNQWDNE